MIGKMSVVGVGLIGGSIASGVKAAGFAERVVGLDTDSQALDQALSMGLIDEAATELPDDSNLTALCMPSDRIMDWVQARPDFAGVCFDVGSVKSHLGSIPARFVPCHPIAGSERSGPAAAQTDLFQGASVVMTPTTETDETAVDLVRACWQALGATPHVLSAEDHDHTLARTSHLPHLLAFAFMAQVQKEDLALSGGGFRDFSRIAAAHPELWWRIFQLNKSAVRASVTQFSADLQALIDAIDADDQEAGLALLQAAADRRRQL